MTIVANNQAKVYGASLPSLTAGYLGLVNGDTAASLTTAPVLTTTATVSSAVASYPIAIGGAVDSNYLITFISGTLAVIFPVSDQTVLQTNLPMEYEKLMKLETNTKVLPKEGTPVRLVIEVPNK